MPDQDIGTIYVLSNRNRSLAKIGLTRDGTPDARATNYERAHGIRWHVYWSALTCSVAEAKQLHIANWTSAGSHSCRAHAKSSTSRRRKRSA